MAASLVSRLRSLVPAAEIKTSDGYGPNSLGYLAAFDPDSRSWRTPQASLLSENSATYSETWPASGSMRNGTLCRRSRSVPLTNGIESSLWPTPQVQDGRHSTANAANREASGRQIQLAHAVALWPTPRATDGTHGGRVTPRKSKEGGNLIEAVAARTWPTPTASRRSGLQSHGTNAILGQLNPLWVEWLMGFPPEWTALPDWGTQSSRKSRKPSAEPLRRLYENAG